MKRWSTLLMVTTLISIFFTGCGEYTIQTTPVIATVVEKQHTHSFGYYIPVNKSYMWVNIPETNNVTIVYQNREKTFDNEKLYETVKVGDSIEVLLYHQLDENGNLCYSDIRLTDVFED